MAEDVVRGEVVGVVAGGIAQPLVGLEGRDGLLPSQENQRLNPGRLALVGLVDYLLVEGDLLVVGE